MEIVLFGLATNVITRLAKKIGISATYVSVGISIVGAIVYWFIAQYNVDMRQNFVASLSGIYATSQVVYQAIKKLGILDKIQ